MDKNGSNAWTKTKEITGRRNIKPQMEVRLTGLTPLHRYRFRVKAENGGGFSDGVETLDIQMNEDPCKCC